MFSLQGTEWKRKLRVFLNAGEICLATSYTTDISGSTIFLGGVAQGRVNPDVF